MPLMPELMPGVRATAELFTRQLVRRMALRLAEDLSGPTPQQQQAAAAQQAAAQQAAAQAFAAQQAASAGMQAQAGPYQPYQSRA